MSQIAKCHICGHEFEAKRSDAKTCSKKCRKALSRGGYRKEPNDFAKRWLKPRTGWPQMVKWYIYCVVCQTGKNEEPGGLGYFSDDHGLRPDICQSCFAEGWRFDSPELLFDRAINVTKNDLAPIICNTGIRTWRYEKWGKT